MTLRLEILQREPERLKGLNQRFVAHLRVALGAPKEIQALDQFVTSGLTDTLFLVAFSDAMSVISFGIFCLRFWVLGFASGIQRTWTPEPRPDCYPATRARAVGPLAPTFCQRLSVNR